MDAGGEDAGGEEAGGVDAGGEDAGGEDTGGEEAGGEEAGCEDAGGDDAGGLPGLEDPVDPPDDGMAIGVGGMDVPVNVAEARLRYALGETTTEDEGAEEAENDAPGLAGGLAAEAGTVAAAPAPACGWR